MSFVPKGGYPPIMKIEEGKLDKVPENRGFSSTNIVSINDIMNMKKRTNLSTFDT